MFSRVLGKKVFPFVFRAGVVMAIERRHEYVNISPTVDFPFFSTRDLNRHEYMNASIAKVRVLHEDKAIMVMDRLGKMYLSANAELERTASTEGDQLRLVLIGRTGQGKSATANTLLSRDRFEEGGRSPTKVTVPKLAYVNGREILVFDTPGLQDTDTPTETTLLELSTVVGQCADGVHAFLYVINLAVPRFTKEDADVLGILTDFFGGEFFKYCIVVFTHGNELREDLDAYCIHQQEVVNKDEPGAKNGANQEQSPLLGSFGGFLEKNSWRKVAIDNHECSPYEKMRNQNVIFNMVDKMREKNDSEVYTHNFFEDAQDLRERRRKADQEKGLTRDDVDLIDRRIACNPDVTDKEIQLEVNQHRDPDHPVTEEEIRYMRTQNAKYLNLFLNIVGTAFELYMEFFGH